MTRGFRRSLELAVRAAVAPVLLGHRWATGGGAAERKDVPARSGSLAVVSKMALDERRIL